MANMIVLIGLMKGIAVSFDIYISIFFGGKISTLFYFFLDLCEDNQFQCEAGLCIPNFQRCDGYDHCPDGTDELDCPSNFENLSLPAEVTNNCFPSIWTIWSCFKAVFTVNLNKPPAGSSQVPPNVDHTSALEL